MAALWGTWMPARLKSNLSATLGPDACKHLTFAAGVHDLGKIDPVFQTQLIQRNAEVFRLTLPEEVRNLEACSSLRRPDFENLRAQLRHEVGSSSVLAARDFPGWVQLVCQGHHGRWSNFPQSGQNSLAKTYRQDVENADWGRRTTDYIDVVSKVTLGSGALEQAPDLLQVSIPLLTGLVSLADWSASDESFWQGTLISEQDIISDPLSYFNARKERATAHIARTLGVASQPQGSFEDVFGFKGERPLQAWVAGANKEGAGLTIVAVPMGEGKTEAALRLQEGSDPKEGLVFALPTQATADSMFERIRTYYSHAPSSVFGNLAHGASSLNAFYLPSDLNPSSICDEGGGLEASRWFKGSHRQLSAPVVVSTCDQVLTLGLAHKYWPVRLASLAGKHVILDEVHTYDPYQSKLLATALTWLGLVGARVTLLSATLPKVQLECFIKAYQKGLNPSSKRQKGLSEGALSYPSISTVALSGATAHHPVAASKSFELSLSYTFIGKDEDSKIEATLARLKELRALNPKAKICLLVNTVNRAQMLASQLPESILLHSRMPFSMRGERTEEVLRLAGKDSAAEPLTVISTQILEASMDVDFDLMLSDLCPMPSLLQRSGRLWRHSQVINGEWRHRAGFDRGVNPVLEVLVPAISAGEDLTSFSAMPYSLAEMSKTLSHPDALNAGQRAHFRIPEDLQAAVDSAHVSLSDLTEVLGAEEYLGSAIRKAQAADNVSSSPGVWDEEVSEFKSWDTPTRLSKITSGAIFSAEAQTRLSDSESALVLISDTPEVGAIAAKVSEGKNKLSTAELILIKSALIPVSGRAASVLNKLAREEFGSISPWGDCLESLLREVSPFSESTLSKNGFDLSKLGLTFNPTGSK